MIMVAGDLGAIARRLFVGSLGTREALPAEELPGLLRRACAEIGINPPTDLMSSVINSHTDALDIAKGVGVVKSFLGKAVEQQERSTPAMPIMQAERRMQQRARSQQPSPQRSSRQHPPPSYPVSVSVFYQGSKHPTWSEHSDPACQAHSERSNIVDYNLALRRFPDLPRSLKPGRSVRNSSVQPHFTTSTECRASQQRTLMDLDTSRVFVPANPAEARGKLVRPIHGFQGTPYEAKRLKDLADYREGKAVRVGRDFKPAYYSELLQDKALFLNSQLTPEAFLKTRKGSPKRVSHSQTFYP